MVPWKKDPRKNGTLEKRSPKKWYLSNFIQLIKTLFLRIIVNIDKFYSLKMDLLSSFEFSETT